MTLRALLSVSDKTGLAPFGQGLVDLGWTLVASGGTARHLRDAGLPVTAVADVTGAPEILGGRVKTLHPAIHGGILARDSAADSADLDAQGFAPIDLVVCNLYPFRETVARPDVDEAAAIEQIDIGGVALLRAAAKNFARVTVICDPADYDGVLAALADGPPDLGTRRKLAARAFAHTAAYDAAIVNWFHRDELLPPVVNLALEKAQELRYGENPHQAGARYRLDGQTGWHDAAVQHKGIPLGYLNLYDADAAWRLVHALSEATGGGPATAIIKHANPCGAAVADDIHDAYQRAYACDPKSAFGGIVAVNRPVDEALAEQILANAKADVVIAPAYTPEGLAKMMSKRKNSRVLEAPLPGPAGRYISPVDGGFLVQEADSINLNRDAWRVASERQPTDAEWRDLVVAWVVCAYTKSNAIVVVKDGVAWGIGAGQQSRVDASELAGKKAAGRANGGAGSSDAFFPFRDGLDAVIAAGATAVIQPGGSIRDQEVIDAADEQGVALVLTGERHFRH